MLNQVILNIFILPLKTGGSLFLQVTCIGSYSCISSWHCLEQILPKEKQWEMQRSIRRRCWPKRDIDGAVEECKHVIILTQLKSSWEKSPPLKSWHIYLVTAIRHFLIQTDSQSFINLPLLLHKVNLNLSEVIPKLVLNKCWLVYRPEFLLPSGRSFLSRAL